MNIKQLTIFIGIIFVCICTGCSSKEDKLVGTWSTAFSLKNDYVRCRVYSISGDHPTYNHYFTFKKGENGNKGTFVDGITAYVFDENEIHVGSKITGTWEIKKDKIFLYYDDNVSLTNANKFGETDKNLLKEEITKQFLKDYRKVGENGVSYEVYKKDGKAKLRINLCYPPLTMNKEEKKD